MEESKVNYGQEFGKNLIKVAKSLLKNQDLLKLLVNTDVDPLGKQHTDIDFWQTNSCSSIGTTGR